MTEGCWFGDTAHAVETARTAGAEVGEDGRITVWGECPTVGLGELEIILPPGAMIKIDGTLTSWASLMFTTSRGVKVMVI